MSAEMGAILAGTVLLEGLAVDQLEVVASRGRRRTAARGERLFLEGDAAEQVGVVLSGRLKLVQLSPDGREVILRLVGRGELFGAVALFEGSAYPAAAVVMEDAEVLLWSGAVLRAAMLEAPQLALNALRLLSLRLRRTQERLRQLATERVERRVAHTLLRLVRHAGRRTDDGVEIDMPVTRQEIAELSGTTLFTVSRVVSAWEEAGLVRAGRQRIVVLDPHRLVALAEDLPPPVAPA